MIQAESFFTGNGKLWQYVDTPNIETIPGKNESALVLRKVLQQRGIMDAKDASAFMEPTLSGLHDPFEMMGMRQAAARIKTAIETQQKILVYGDYDVDGTTAVSILLSFFRKMKANADFYIPDRVDEGYGISAAAVELIGSGDIDLLITVDCGITAGALISRIQEMHTARGRAIDIIVTDHHQIHEDSYPVCLAVVNPHQPGDNYPYKALCGAGIAFKMVDALGRLMNLPNVHEEYLDLAALATIADIVDLSGENRIIAKYGIEQMNTGKHLGISKLVEVSGSKPGTLDAMRVGFSLAPRVNAAGRMGDASRAVKLLISEDITEATQLANSLEQVNVSRQKAQETIYQEAVQMIKSDAEVRNNKVLVIWGDGWHHGVIGIVASKLVEQFHKPSFVFAISDGEAIGSGRSVEGYHLFDALASMADMLTRFGGHEQAGGVTLSRTNLDEFRRRINMHADQNLTPASMVQTLVLSANLEESFIRLTTAKALLKLEPFGQGNRIPLFSARDLLITEVFNTSDGKHLRLKFQCAGDLVEGISFGDGALMPYLSAGMKVDAAFALERNLWMGKESLKLRIVDMRLPIEKARKNMYFLKTASKLECLDCDEEWLYNDIKHSGMEPRTLMPSLDEYAGIYRWIGKRSLSGVSKAELFKMADRIPPINGNQVNYLKLFVALLVFDELELLRFTLNPDETYEIICEPSPVKVDLMDSGLVQLLTAVLDAFG